MTTTNKLITGVVLLVVAAMAAVTIISLLETKPALDEQFTVDGVVEIGTTLDGPVIRYKDGLEIRLIATYDSEDPAHQLVEGIVSSEGYPSLLFKRHLFQPVEYKGREVYLIEAISGGSGQVVFRIHVQQ